MPYIITTTPDPSHGDYDAEGGPTVWDNPFRTAVATLDEAREHIRPMLPAGVADLFSVADGGSIGPLPDGTVIEVRPIGWFDFERMAVDPEDAADVDIATFDSDEYRDGLIAAFNAS